MPTYKHKEEQVTLADESTCKEARKPRFEPFNLQTSERSQSRTKRGNPTDQTNEVEQSKAFKARKMPDFTSDSFNGVKPVSPKKLTSFAPLNLSTFTRGADKQAKLVDRVKQ